MALRLLQEGWYGHKPFPGREGVMLRVGKGNDRIITVGQIPEYFTNDFWTAYEAYSITEMLNVLPFSGGWAEQPLDILSAIVALKQEERSIEADRQKD